jgi:hypothetical protein
VTDDALFDLNQRHIVVRSQPGACGEVVHTAAELEKWLATHPDGYVAYDSLHGIPQVHVLMPNMAYACGLTVLDFRPGHARMIVGPSEERWDTVTCPECRAPGREALAAQSRRQQGCEVPA